MELKKNFQPDANLDNEKQELLSRPMEKTLAATGTTESLKDKEMPYNCQVAPQFTVFSQLSTELRFKIWKHALPEPRVVITRIRDSKEKHDIGEFGLAHCKKFVGKEHLLTCRESRQIFFENYQRLTLSSVGITRTYPSYYSTYVDALKHDYINVARDTLVIPVSTLDELREAGHSLDLSPIQNLGLAHTSHIKDDQPTLGYALAICPNLKKFTVVSGYSEPEINLDEESGVLHIVQANSELRFMEIVDDRVTISRDQRVHAFAQEPLIVDWMEECESKKGKIDRENTISEEEKKSLDPEVGMLAVKRPVKVDDQNIISRARQQCQVACVMHKPVEHCTDYRMDISRWSFSGSCREDGTLDCPYDGIRELYKVED